MNGLFYLSTACRMGWCGPDGECDEAECNCDCHQMVDDDYWDGEQ